MSPLGFYLGFAYPLRLYFSCIILISLIPETFWIICSRNYIYQLPTDTVWFQRPWLGLLRTDCSSWRDLGSCQASEVRSSFCGICLEDIFDHVFGPSLCFQRYYDSSQRSPFCTKFAKDWSRGASSCFLEWTPLVLLYPTYHQRCRSCSSHSPTIAISHICQGRYK